MTESAKRRLGIIEILLSGFCFGFLGVFGKSLYAQGVTPGELLSLRFLIGGGLIGTFLLLRRPKSLRISFRALLSCAALGAFGYAVFSSCYFYALTGLSASLTVLLLYLYPVIVALGAWLFFQERISREKWFVLPVTMLGLILLVWGEIYVKDPWALAFGFGSAIFYSIYILSSSRILRNLDPYVSVTYIQIFAGVALAILHWRDGQRIASVVENNWPLLLTLGLVCSVAAMGLFLAGLQKLKSWEVSILSMAEPITAIALAMTLLGETLSSQQIAGAVLVLSGFVFISMPEKKKK